MVPLTCSHRLYMFSGVGSYWSCLIVCRGPFAVIVPVIYGQQLNNTVSSEGFIVADAL